MGKGKSKRQLRQNALRGYATHSMPRASASDDNDAPTMETLPQNLIVDCTLSVGFGGVQLHVTAAVASLVDAPKADTPSIAITCKPPKAEPTIAPEPIAPEPLTPAATPGATSAAASAPSCDSGCELQERLPEVEALAQQAPPFAQQAPPFAQQAPPFAASQPQTIASGSRDASSCREPREAEAFVRPDEEHRSSTCEASEGSRPWIGRLRLGRTRGYS